MNDLGVREYLTTARSRGNENFVVSLMLQTSTLIHIGSSGGGEYLRLVKIATEVLNGKEKIMEKEEGDKAILVGLLSKLNDEDYNAVTSKVTKIREEASLRDHIGHIYKKEGREGIYFFAPREVTDGYLRGNEYSFTDEGRVVIQSIRVIVGDISSWKCVGDFELAASILSVVKDDVSLVHGR